MVARQKLIAVWNHLQRCQSLGDVAAARHGLRWKRGLRDHFDEIVKSEPTNGYAKGVRPRLRAFFSFQRPQTAYLLFSRDEIKKAFDLQWDQPKVIMNKTAKARSRWRVAAFADNDGLVCSESSLAVWPNAPTLLKPLAGVLNGPVANAFLTERSGKREFTTDVIHQIPFPSLSGSQVKEINRLVDTYLEEVEKNDLTSDEDDAKANAILRKIDAVILDAYALPPRLERALLDYFNDDTDRHVPFEFGPYFPPSFRPTIPLSMYLSDEFQESTAERFLGTLPSITDPDVIETLEAME